jgi:hypothetical protein
MNGGAKRSIEELRKLSDTKVLSKFSDLVGSATNNKVGGWEYGYGGHSDEYYASSPNFAQQVECFANIYCIYGQDDVFLHKVIEKLMPNMTKAFKEIL